MGHDDGAFGRRLRELRTERGLSLRGLAQITKVTFGYLSEMERGVKQPHPDTAEKLDEALGAEGTLAILVRRMGGNSASHYGAAADRAVVDQVKTLRDRLTDTISATATSDPTVDDWEHTALEQGRATRYRSAQALVDDLASDLTQLDVRLKRQNSTSVQLRLTRVTAQMAGLMFLTLIKLNERGEARSWAHTARVAASEAGDRALQSWVRAQEAFVHYYSRDLRQAVLVATHAQELAGRRPCVGVALAAALEARARAAMGEVAETQRAIGMAEVALADLDQESVVASAFGYNEAQLRFHEGNALTHLQHRDRAWRAHCRALELYPYSDYLDRVLVHLDRAECLARGGDVLDAMEYATGALLGLKEDQRNLMITRRALEVFEAVPVRQRTMPAAREFHEVLMLPSSEKSC